MPFAEKRYGLSSLSQRRSCYAQQHLHTAAAAPQHAAAKNPPLAEGLLRMMLHSRKSRRNCCNSRRGIQEWPVKTFASATSRCGSLLRSPSADACYSDDVVAFKDYVNLPLLRPSVHPHYPRHVSVRADTDARVLRQHVRLR